MLNRSLAWQVLIIFIIFAAASIYVKFDDVVNYALNDTDDLMHIHQYKNWFIHKNWYLQPLSQLNPQDGQIMHWSRAADLLPFAIASFMSLFLSFDNAILVANFVTPLIYLLGTMLVLVALTNALFDKHAAQIAVFMPMLSLVTVKFIPGAMDHHNLQILSLALSLLLAFKFLQTNNKNYLPAIALTMVFSMWIGLENAYALVAIIAVLFFRAVFEKNSLLLQNLANLFGFLVIFTAVILVVNRPISEFFAVHYDAVSFPFLCALIAGYAVLLINSLVLRRFENISILQNLALLMLLGLVFFVPVLYYFPYLVKGYANYPEFLRHHWLGNVSEAMPLLNQIDDIVKPFYVLSLVPAMLFPFVIKKRDPFWLVLYVAFVLNILLALFFQLRTTVTATICAIPLQAAFIAHFRDIVKSVLAKTIILLLGYPVVMILLVFVVQNFFDKTEHSNLGESNSSAVENVLDKKEGNVFYITKTLLDRNNIHKANILAPIDLGAGIIALTDNNTLAAPYHRNIRGNTEAIKFFIANDDSQAIKILKENKIDYVISQNSFLELMQELHPKEKDLLAKKIYENQLQEEKFLQLIDENGELKLYRVKLAK